jgi:hypothetical protein
MEQRAARAQAAVAAGQQTRRKKMLTPDQLFKKKKMTPDQLPSSIERRERKRLLLLWRTRGGRNEKLRPRPVGREGAVAGSLLISLFRSLAIPAIP